MGRRGEKIKNAIKVRKSVSKEWNPQHRGVLRNSPLGKKWSFPIPNISYYIIWWIAQLSEKRYFYETMLSYILLWNASPLFIIVKYLWIFWGSNFCSETQSYLIFHKQCYPKMESLPLIPEYDEGMFDCLSIYFFIQKWYAMFSISLSILRWNPYPLFQIMVKDCSILCIVKFLSENGMISYG